MVGQGLWVYNSETAWDSPAPFGLIGLFSNEFVYRVLPPMHTDISNSRDYSCIMNLGLMYEELFTDNVLMI